MTWVLAILIHAFLSGLRSLQSKRIGRLSKDTTAYALFASFVSIILFGVIFAILNPADIQVSVAMHAWAFLLVGGFLFATFNYITLKLFRDLSTSIVVLLGLLNTVSVLVLSSVFAGESLSAKQWIGTVLLVFSAAFSKSLSVKKTKKSQHRRLYYVLLACFTALLFGIAIINEKYLLERIGTTNYLLFGWGMQSVAATLISLRLGLREQVKTKLSTHVNVWILGGLLAISGYFFIQSLTISNSASLTVLGSSLKLVASLVLAYIFLSERERPVLKVLSVIIASVGFWLVT